MRRLLCLVILLMALPAPRAGAQETPRTGYVYPAGAQRGGTVEVAVGGRNLEGVKAAEFSGSGVTAQVILHMRPMSAQQFNLLRTKLRDLEKKKEDAIRETVRINRLMADLEEKYEDDLERWEAEKAKLTELEKARREELNRRREEERQWMREVERIKQQQLQRERAAQVQRERQKGTTRPATVPVKPATFPAAPKQKPLPPLPVLRPRPKPPVAIKSKVVWTKADEAALADARKRISYGQLRRTTPAIAETVLLKVTVDSQAELGSRELRLVGRGGVSNPRVFHIGQFHELTEGPPPPPPPGRREPNWPPPKRVVSTTLPAVLNGQIMPGEINYYRFQAKRGQRLVIATSARELVPYMADAVPGWFQAVVSLRDANGKEVAFADDFRFNPDPVLYYEVAADGEYTLLIHDSIYRGREDFVYRITIGEIPFITSIFPLGGSQGTTVPVELRGWNLSSSRLMAPTSRPGLAQISVDSGPLRSNALPFAVGTLHEVMEQEPNDQTSRAQHIIGAAIINGRIDRPGDWDVYRFRGLAGQKFVAEVIARRLGSPLDSFLRLTDAKGKQLAANDDFEDKAAALTTHHADSLLMATLPADGDYYVHIGDTQGAGGPEYGYRLRIGDARPDFELRSATSALSVRTGATVPLTVHALRRDGFEGEIELSLKDAPSGCVLSGARIPAGQDKVRLSITAPVEPLKQSVSLTLQGTASIAGQKVVRTAVAADDLTQAFSYRHLVPAEHLMLTVFGQGSSATGIRLLSAMPLLVPAGGNVLLHVEIPSSRSDDRFEFQLSDPPEGITVAGATADDEGVHVTVLCDAKVKPGLKGNLLLTGLYERTPPPTTQTAKPAKRRVPVGLLPAVPFEVVAATP
jgi:hypothetical protein